MSWRMGGAELEAAQQVVLTRSYEPGSQEPTVSVGIPFYAGVCPAHMRAAIDSVLNQSYRVDEVHLVQDGPVPDEIKELVDDYLRQYPKVRLTVFPHHVDLSCLLNTAILNSTGKYFARMDADDICHQDRLRKQIEYMERNPDVDVLGTWAIEFTDSPDDPDIALKKTPCHRQGIARLFHYRNPIIHPSVVFKRDCFARIGLYTLGLPGNEDYELWGRALKSGLRMANLPEPLLYYRAACVATRRNGLDRVLAQSKACFTYNTWSPKLNALKICALLFRLLPPSVMRWGYRHLRGGMVKVKDQDGR